MEAASQNSETYDQESVVDIAGAYQAAILKISAGGLGSLPDRATRMAIMKALLRDARPEDSEIDRKQAAIGNLAFTLD